MGDRFLPCWVYDVHNVGCLRQYAVSVAISPARVKGMR
ncbi:hypothetical protein BVRB_5g103400 [Beta vulgaris subsp. vulgaris]|nr:hypothetical protein BVRB_5g103400 [Beta vulgaris subsp. vulgaris]